MWKVTLQAFAVLLMAWFLGNFVLGWFQQNSAKPKTQHSEHPSRTPDSQDQSCFCQVSHLHTVLSVTVRSGRRRSGFCGLTESSKRGGTTRQQLPFRKSSSIFYCHLNLTSPFVCVCVCDASSQQHSPPSLCESHYYFKNNNNNKNKHSSSYNISCSSYISR